MTRVRGLRYRYALMLFWSNRDRSHQNVSKMLTTFAINVAIYRGRNVYLNARMGCDIIIKHAEKSPAVGLKLCNS